MSRRRQDLQSIDIAAWPTIDTNALTAAQRASFDRRRRAIELFARGETARAVEKSPGINVRQLYHLLDRSVCSRAMTAPSAGSAVCSNTSALGAIGAARRYAPPAQTAAAASWANNKAGFAAALAIAMESFARAVEVVLKEGMVHDASGVRLPAPLWRRAVRDSGYVQTRAAIGRIVSELPNAA